MSRSFNLNLLVMTIPVQCCASQLPVNGARIKCGMVARTAANEIISRRSRRWSGNERLVSLLRRVAASFWRPRTQMLPVDTPLKRSPSVDTVCGHNEIVSTQPVVAACSAFLPNRIRPGAERPQLSVHQLPSPTCQHCETSKCFSSPTSLRVFT